ncbi:asparagine synthase (glutamine-hydrolyzing) [Polynucleobacter sp. Adler-ghost]|uniref:asparagine synthase (glutamine-hydrolyzing) n=1 Tax=Polynucleobacter sp. Adler-ghost TaxID=2770234 RepID=UPI001BFDA4E1|nr:asparagine synthase (glutamine-hydrolyzing) [Polynucleobacter sp. Adler-ghost]QWE31033.1 asparagine synthase (glutamine-hydrolyzing) [Polynucleobacter sp. Adler-ghost]
MCGIAGILGGEIDPHLLDKMTDSLAHRGPDGRGVWINHRFHIGLGHRRLAIIDTSSAGNQPMHSSCGRYTIVFNGEIYNYIEIKRALSYNSSSSSDTEIILAAYIAWGESCVHHFNGMFAFAIWDHDKNKLFCSRDRLGVKPFFYTQRNGQFFFASEIKGLLAAGIEASPNLLVWGKYLSLGEYEQPDESFFNEIHSLKPGHSLTINIDLNIQIHQWWKLTSPNIRSPKKSLDEIIEELGWLMDQAVKIRMRSDVAISLNLTGGLDSSAITESFLRQSNFHQGIHVFTALFDDPRYDEDQYASKVINGKNIIRHTPRLTPELVPSMAINAMLSQEAPYGGIGTLSYELIDIEMEKLGLKVSLEGQGGDELFAGYEYFKYSYFSNLLNSRDFFKAFSFLLRTSNQRKLLSQAFNTKFIKKAVYQDGSNYLNTLCIKNEIHHLAKPTIFDRPFSDNLANELHRDLTQTKLYRVLRMNDRKSMAHGVELRQPLLDYRVVEFAASLPADIKITPNFNKYVLRAAMRNKLPDEITWSKKRPVVTPQREWMTKQLSDWVLDLVNSTNFRNIGFFNVTEINRSMSIYKKNGLANSFPIWQWVNTALWFDAFIYENKSK